MVKSATMASVRKYIMAGVAQLVRAPGCGSGGRGFDPHHSPQIEYQEQRIIISVLLY